MEVIKSKELSVHCAVVDMILSEYRAGGYDKLIEKHRKKVVKKRKNNRFF
jgi:hypothetical protein